MRNEFFVGSRRIISNPKCIKALSTGVAMGFFYFLMMLFGYLSGEPLPVLEYYWAITKLLIAYSLICLYRTTGIKKYAGGGVIILTSSFMTFLSPITRYTSIPILMDSLSIALMSLTIFDVGKAIPEAGLERPAGAVFIGLMLALVSQSTMSALGLLLIIIGTVYATNRLNIVYHYVSKRA